MRRIFTPATGAFILALFAFVPAAFAQPLLPDNGALPDSAWHHGTTLDLFASTATTSQDTRGAFGGAFGWEINHWVDVEGSGTWLAARQGDQAFTANLKAMVNLTRPRLVVPFLGAGVGIYHASYDPASGATPAFYQRRLPSEALGSLATFNDPAFVFDGGVNIFVGRHVSLRPDVNVTVVTRASDTYTVVMAVMHVTYHFEMHGVPR